MATPHPMLTQDYASHWMGIRVLDLAEGYSRIEMDIRREMLNGFGIAHGGMTFAFADTAFALACNSSNPEDLAQHVTVSTGADVTYLASPTEGQTLTAEATLISSYGRNCLVDVVVTSGTQEMLRMRGRGRRITPPTQGKAQ